MTIHRREQQNAGMEKILAYLDNNLDASLERLLALLRIPSISAQPAHAADCRRAAEWARDELSGMGFSARLSETTGLPGVIATHHAAGPAAPHVLFYGHYDVQPADPLALWHSGPFDPQIVDGPRGRRIVGRGAVDDKGQVVSFFTACRAHLEVTGTLPVRLTILLEGEEECGSPSLKELLTNERETLAADFVLVADTNMWDFETPAITVSLRGLAAAELKIKAASRDLHSGLYGGIALNPIAVMTRILGDLRDDQGGIRIPGFYDGIQPVPAALAESWAGLGFDSQAFLSDVGLTSPAGEHGQSPLAQLWARPTAEINGIYGGYQGDGSKTVIPAEAGQAHLPPGARPDSGKNPRRIRAFRERSPAAGRKSRIPQWRRRAWLPSESGRALHAGGARGTGGRIRPAGGTYRRRRLDPRGRSVQNPSRAGHAAGRLRAG